MSRHHAEENSQSTDVESQKEHPALAAMAPLKDEWVRGDPGANSACTAGVAD